MNQIVIDILGIVTAVLLLIFSVFLATYRKGRIYSHRFLSAFLLSNAIFIIDFLLPEIERALNIELSILRGIGFTFAFLFGPLLFIYTKSITTHDFSCKFTCFLHLLPFIIVISFRILTIRIPFNYIFGIMQLQTSIYMVACFVQILNYRKEIKHYLSSIEKLNLTWLLYVVGAFFIMWMIDLVTFILANMGVLVSATFLYLTFLSLLINFVFAVLIFYKALLHPEIFTGILKVESGPKYEQSKLSEEKKAEYLSRLERYFSQQKPFLNPALTIGDVASDLQISSKYISQIINESLHKNFYDFINSYRIEESKRLLLEDLKSDKTVLEILYDSGFNSKSAFNAAFKKHTGTTPTIYRTQQISA